MNPGPEGAVPHDGAADRWSWRAYAQDELDAQYDQRTRVPDAPARMAVWAERSARARAATPPLTRAYGAGPDETLHVFPGRPGAPAHLHLHGGAWRLGAKEDSSLLAPALGLDGAHVVVADFSPAPAARLPAIVGQVRRAALWVMANAAHFGWAAGAVHVSGHSSGAHLAATLIDRRTPDDGLRVSSLVLVSGVYDLHPVRASARNAYLNLTPAEAAALSPVEGAPAAPPPAALFCAEGDLDEFRRQCALYASALREAGGRVGAEVLPGLDHFSIYDRFAAPEGPVARAARNFMHP